MNRGIAAALLAGHFATADAACQCVCMEGRTVQICESGGGALRCLPIPGCETRAAPRSQSNDPCAGLSGGMLGVCRWEQANCRVVEVANPQTGQPELRKICAP